jgi:regulator of protease activity HflC (stomatin/prohibitin superfamily)
VQESSSPKLDQVSLQMLLFLSSEQALTIAEIAQALDQTSDAIYGRAVILEQHHFVEEEDDKLRISREGTAYMRERDARPPKTAQAAAPKEADVHYHVMLFPILILVGLVLILTSLIIRSVITVHIAAIIASVVLLAATIIYVAKSCRKVAEYERIVVFRLGKCIGAKGPGLVFLLPFVDKLTTVDLRVRHQAIPHEACITKDTVQIGVDFVFYWKVQQPILSVTTVTDAEESIKLLATALLRAAIAGYSFRDALNKREEINLLLKDKINAISSEWGMYVTNMEIREIKPPEEIVKSMHQQREAEWRGQATVINAEAQAEALRLLYRIATQIDDKTLSLKYFEMLRDLGKGEATKYIFPLELIDLIRPLFHSPEGGKSASETDANKPSDEKKPTQSQDPSDLPEKGS